MKLMPPTKEALEALNELTQGHFIITLRLQASNLNMLSL